MNSPSPTSPRRQQLQMCAVMGTYLTISTSAMADAPAGLTPKDLSKLDQLSKPTAEQTTTDRLNTQKTIQEHTELSKKARAHITPFLNSIGKGTLLAQNPSATTTNTPPATPPTKPEATTPKLNEGESTLLVECDGGLYFDNETGILAYLKNIRLTEDRFKLTCRDELKVFLSQDEKKDDKADNKTDKPTNKKPEKEKEKENQLSSFGNLKQIIATGDVKVTRLDDQGKPFIAMSETASYEAKTGEIILRGGRPRLQQSANQYLQAQEPGQWIKVLKSGKLVTSSGKWKMVAILKNR